MKKVLLGLSFSFLVNLCFGQTIERSLKLVGFITIDSSFAIKDSVTFSAPPGKIWKIENIISGERSSVCINTDRNCIIQWNYSSYSFDYLNYNPGVPIWLSSADRIIFQNGFNSCLNGTCCNSCRIKITAFEFILE